MSDIIKLNVGGFRYETTLDTLSREPESMLASMFSGRHKLACDQDNYYFIDRNGELFKYILKYLRDGKINLNDASESVVRDLIDEAEYYCLGSLVAFINRDTNQDTNIDRKILYDTIIQQIEKLTKKYYCYYHFYLIDFVKQLYVDFRNDSIKTYPNSKISYRTYECPANNRNYTYLLEKNDMFAIWVIFHEATDITTIEKTFNKFKKEIGLA